MADPLDPAVSVINEAIAQNPRVPVTLIVGDKMTTANPKVNNLIKGVDAARHELLLMCDANIAVEPTTLTQMFAVLAPDVGVVWAIPIAARPLNFVGELECAMFNGFSARWLLASKHFGRVACVGKTMLLRKSDLGRIGAARSMASGLCEDAVLGHAFRALGLRMAVANEPAKHPIGKRNFRDFWERHLRWHCCRRRHEVLAFIAQPFLPAPVAIVTGALFWSHVTDTHAVAAAVVSLGAWLSIEGVYLWRLQWPLSWRGPAAWLVRELLLPALWVQAAITTTIRWCGDRVDVMKDGAESARLSGDRAANLLGENQ